MDYNSDLYYSAGEVNEDDMPLTERGLAEDAPWKQIQKNTFTRWCNEHLKCVNKRIANLELDLSDGLRLISLLEVLSQKKMAKYNKRPNFRQMKLENVSVALRFLEKERIKLVSIDSKAIVDGNLKLILGLIWTLILHYSISMPMWDEEDEEQQMTKATPKQRLLGWIQNKVPQMPITNFKGDWQDGKALGALVDNCAPGLCPDWVDWDPKNKLANATTAMNLADDHLGIPQVIAPEEITNPNVDEQSVMTYLSQFPKAQLKPGAPLRPKTNAKKARAYGKGVEPNGCKIGTSAPFTVETFGAGNGKVAVFLTDPAGNKQELKTHPNNDKLKTYSVSYHPTMPGKHEVQVLFAGVDVQKSPFLVNVDDSPTDPDSVTAKGPGLQPGNTVGHPTHFDVYTEGAGLGEVEVKIEDPNGNFDTVKPVIEKGLDGDSHRVTYTPKENGPHKVFVTFAGYQIPNSPFDVPITLPFNPNEVWAEGPGVEPEGMLVKQKASFVVHTENAGNAKLEVKCIGPRGINEIVNIQNNGDGTYSCDYYPLKPGQYVVNVNYGGEPGAGSPYRVNVDMPPDPSKVKVQGPGIEPGNVVGEQTYFDVLTAAAYSRPFKMRPAARIKKPLLSDSGSGEVEVAITAPDGTRSGVPVQIEDRGNGTSRCYYTPENTGVHRVNVNFGGEPLPNSPYKVEVVPSGDEPQQRSALNTALKPGQTPQDDRDARALPSGLLLEADEEITPTEQAHLLEHEPLISAFNANACRAFGRGIQPKGLRMREKAEFHVSTENAGEADLSVTVKGPMGSTEPVNLTKNPVKKNVYDCEYYPLKTGDYNIEVKYGGKNIPKSPFKVFVDKECGPQKVRAFGPGLSGGKVGDSADFVVETTGTDVGQLGFAIEGPSQAKINCEDKGDGSCDVKYYPTEPGEYAVHVVCDDQDIEGSPFMAQILPADNKTFPDKVKAFGPGLESGTPVTGEPTKFTLDASQAGEPAPVEVMAKADGKDVPVTVDDLGNGLYECSYTPLSAAKHTIIPSYDGVAVKDSPFRVNVQEDSHSDQVKVYGPGVEPGLKADEPTYFTVDCSKAGAGDVSIGIMCAPGVVSPVEQDVDFEIVKDEDTDTFTVRYVPPGPGEHTIKVLFADEEVPQSPIKVNVASTHNANLVRAEGPGVEKEGVECGKPTYFTLHTRDAGKAKPDVQFKPARGSYRAPVKKAEIIDNHDSTYTVNYTPHSDGPMDVVVTYGGDPIAESPFEVDVAPPLDLDKVIVKDLGDKMYVGEPKAFEVLTAGAGGQGNLEVDVVGPSQKPLKANMVDTPKGKKVELLPEEEGPYKVDVKYDGEPVKGSPFLVEALAPADPSKVRAYGPGLSEGKVGHTAPFTIETMDAGNGGLGLTVEGPCEAKIECIDKGDGSCSVTYLPTEPGDYKINVLFADEHVPGSPFTAKIEPAFDASQVKLSGPGLESGKVGKASRILADCSDAGDAPLTVDVVNEDGTRVPNVRVRDNGDGTHDVSFIPDKPGQATVNVKYGDEAVPDSPAYVPIKPDIDTSGVKCSGPGVQQEGVLADVDTPFAIDAKSLAPRGGDHIKAKLVGPSGTEVPVEVVDNKDGTYDATYAPVEQGPHDLFVDYDDVPVAGSPFPINVVEGCDASKVKAYGPGLESGTTSKPAKFTVDTRGAGTGGLGLAVEGPSDAKITCKDCKDGTCAVDYLPTAPGDYEVNITYGGENISGSPFVVTVADVVDPSKVTCNGPGLSSGVRANIPQEFTIDCSKAGVAPLDVAVKGPRSLQEPVELVDNEDGTYTAKYTPTKEGTHHIQVKYADEDVPHSPYRVRVQPKHDASKVKCSGPGISSTGVPASIPVEFLIDATEAGEGPLAVQITNPKREKYSVELPPPPREAELEQNVAPGHRRRREKRPKDNEPLQVPRQREPKTVEATDPEGRPRKANVTDNGDGTYAVSYIPDQVGRYSISVKYGGDEIPFSPYRVRATPSGDASKCKVTVSFGPGRRDGLGPTIGIGQEAVITVDANNAGPGKATCEIATPDGGLLNSEVVENRDGTFDIFYTAPAPGLYKVNVNFGGEPVPHSPYRVTAEPRGNQFVIDEEAITPSTAPVAQRLMNGNEPAIEQIDGELAADALRPVELVFDVPSRPGKLSSKVTTPSGRKDTPKIRNNGDGTVTIDYQPSEKGLHEMAIWLDQEHISGSPIQFYADVVAPGHVTAYGSGLVTGKVDEPAEFTIVTKDAGAGGLALAVEGPSKAEIKCVDNMDGTCSVSYLPTAPGEYTITVKFDDENIPGSPYTAHIAAGADQRKSKLAYGTTSDVPLKINESDISLLSAAIESPSGHKKDCALKKLPNGHIGISFTPQEVGEHLVSVKKRGRHVSNSPFSVMVGASEIADASKVKVYGEGCEKAVAGETAAFKVDTRKAGYGGLGLSIEGPSKVDINCDDLDDGVCEVSYTPQEPGDYVINVKFADKHVPGSPYHIKCSDEGVTLKESIVRQQKAAPVAKVGSTCDLNLKIPDDWMTLMSSNKLSSSTFHQTYSRSEQTSYRSSGSGKTQTSSVVQERFGTSPTLPQKISEKSNFSNRQGQYAIISVGDAGDLTAEVKSPSGRKEAANIVQSSDNTYSIRFVPKEMGTHVVSVKYMGEHVPGSPFQFTVGPIGEGGAGKVTASGPGLEGAVVNVPAEFSIWTREAGAGGLSIAVEGPSKAEISFDDRKDGSCGVSYIVTEPGDYDVSVKFNDEHIPGSAFPVHVTGIGKTNKDSPRFKSDASKVRSYGAGLKKAMIGETNTFSVDCSAAGSNMLLVGIHGPLTPCEEVYIKHLGQRNYTVTYTAKEPGQYLLIVKWGDDHIPGSPFHVTVP